MSYANSSLHMGYCQGVTLTPASVTRYHALLWLVDRPYHVDQ